MPLVNCKICQKEFNKPQYKINRSQNNYCSKNCSGLGQKTSKVLPCKECGKEVLKKPFEIKNNINIFCTHSCAASYNNRKYPKKFPEEPYTKCLNCYTQLNRKGKFCTRICNTSYNKYQMHNAIEKGDIKKHTKSYKKYLIEKYGEKCMKCGWCERNPHTGNIPIELEHIDGNFENNTLKNLELLCPNCHSLTSTYKGANVGKGRHYRRQRYAEGKSF